LLNQLRRFGAKPHGRGGPDSRFIGPRSWAARRTTLSHLYSSHTGDHLWQVILQQRLARAARLLTEGDAAIKEVAWCCGFASASYFIRCFRQHFGLTPKAYPHAPCRYSLVVHALEAGFHIHHLHQHTRRHWP